MNRPQLVDLFSGAGGLSVGFRDAGFNPVFAADWNAHACATYEVNLGPHSHQIDLGSADPTALAKEILNKVGAVDVVGAAHLVRASRYRDARR
ncbi:MAG: DNA cytosine methyltransferase [Sandaracinaceae bacterium]|nr:DNA cytosine methyltransferase [Sandaracinaceae bacterium]